MTECMAVMFIDVTKCRAVQRNHFRSNMENHIIIGLFRGSKVMVQKNRMKEQRTTDQNKEIEEREWFKKYTLVHLVQVVYTCGFTEKKRAYTYTHTFTERKAHTCWKDQGFGLRYLV